MILLDLLCINGVSHVEEVVWPLFHVVIHVFCTSVRIPLLALPWSDPVAFSFPCCFCLKARGQEDKSRRCEDVRARGQEGKKARGEDVKM